MKWLNVAPPRGSNNKTIIKSANFGILFLISLYIDKQYSPLYH